MQKFHLYLREMEISIGFLHSLDHIFKKESTPIAEFFGSSPLKSNGMQLSSKTLPLRTPTLNSQFP